MTVLFVLIAVFFLFLGAPLYIALFGLSAYLFSTTDQLPLISAVVSFQRLQSQEFIAAIPLFTFSGYLLARSGSPGRILRLIQSAFAYLPGAEAMVVILVMAFFTALTGASGVTILALGGLMFPLLREGGKSEEFSLGLITSSGSIGLLFAPSLPVIVYAVVASQNLSSGRQVDIRSLFQVALVPSFILIGAVMVYVILFGGKKEKSHRKKFSLRSLKKALIGARYEIPIVFLIYGGIYSGLFTVLEAAGVTAFYIFIMEFFLYRELKFGKDLVPLTVESLKLAGSVFIIMATAFILTNYLVDQRISEQIFKSVSSVIHGKITFLLVANLFLLLSGCLLDIFSAILILLPILIPIVENYGIDPYHFAIIFLVNLEIGYLTPPVGMNLFIAGHRFKRPITLLYRVCLPFLAVMVSVLLLLTYVPFLSVFSLDTSKTKDVDLRPPGQIDTLTIKKIEARKVVIQFQAVGNDGKKGRAFKYEVRLFDLPIETEDDFTFAEEITLDSPPLLSGEEETIEIGNLTPAQQYWMAIRAWDDNGNVGLWSKILSFSTLSP